MIALNNDTDLLKSTSVVLDEYHNLATPKRSAGAQLIGDEFPEILASIPDVILKIASFASLPENWDSYGAISPTEQTIGAAISFAFMAHIAKIPLFFTAPGPNGEIVIELKKGELEVEVEFLNDNSEVAVFRGDELLIEGHLHEYMEEIKELFGN